MRHKWSMIGALTVLPLIGCDAASPLAPSPETRITHGPEAQVIHGTVRETRPYPQVRVAGATVEACGAVTRTDAFGAFTLSTTRTCQILSVSAPGYENAAIRLSERRDELVDIELMPQLIEVEERRTGTAGARLDLASQRGGAATITLEWSSPDTDFDLILWHESKQVAYSTRIGGTTEQVRADLAPGEMYDLVVFRYAGPDVPWTLTIRRPR